MKSKILRLSWITVFVIPDPRLKPDEFEVTCETLCDQLARVYESRRFTAAAARHQLDSARIEVFVLNAGNERPYLGDHARVYENADMTREADGSALILVEQWSQLPQSDRVGLVTQQLDSYFADIAGVRGKVRSVIAGTEPRSVLWRWIEGAGNADNLDSRMEELKSSLSAYSRARLLLLGDDIMAALAILDTPRHSQAAAAVLGPLSIDRFAELRGYVVLLGRELFAQYRNLLQLPRLPPNSEWSPLGEEMRFLVANQLGWDAWDGF